MATDYKSHFMHSFVTYKQNHHQGIQKMKKLRNDLGKSQLPNASYLQYDTLI